MERAARDLARFPPDALAPRAWITGGSGSRFSSAKARSPSSSERCFSSTPNDDRSADEPLVGLRSGEEVQDVIRRRVLGPRELELYATLSGFDIVEIANESGATMLTGPGASMVARYRGFWGI